MCNLELARRAESSLAWLWLHCHHKLRLAFALRPRPTLCGVTTAAQWIDGWSPPPRSSPLPSLFSFWFRPLPQPPVRSALPTRAVSLFLLTENYGSISELRRCTLSLALSLSPFAFPTRRSADRCQSLENVTKEIGIPIPSLANERGRGG